MSLLKKIFSSTAKSEYTDIQSKYNERPPLDPETKEERFTTQFVKNGGKFLYCENLFEIQEQFLNILTENDWFECDVLCYEESIFSMLEENKLNYFTAIKPKFLFTTCENLITEDGSVLFSSNQIKQHKPNDLPTNIIVFATIKQIVETKSDGLRCIQNKYQSNYPSNITTIKYFEETKEKDFLNYGSVAKNIYLLLLDEL